MNNWLPQVMLAIEVFMTDSYSTTVKKTYSYMYVLIM